MTTILRLESSIKGEAAVSRKLTDRIIARLTAAHPEATVITRDLSKGLSHINGAWLGAVYTPAEARDSDQQTIAATADELLDEVKAADTLVIALPVYNFGVPAHLKAWIDNIARKGESFTYTENGPIGLLTGKRAIVAFTSDGTKMGSELDHASGYLRQILGFFGITDVDFVAADQIVFGPEAAMAKAEAEIDALAA
ncbi:FMN-dependent NADH-azoreductase [Cereibacter changlensis JA139]|uniref:FMN dependent NADH:quinone oxidoreductase n=2 Tax=Cereibacter changlensis TaxID=402884 RepID=A0A2T4JVB0_9RHOB|nr:NAD(P)H-dependent oxidoreductase [Cereibacter changlensis]PTE21860.1 FMN-dependent NADH-azoreductase [Cereibacter changlensis JA139]PZX51603.1 FMN-dependent NADH-azoreductase [Cereibacter changlensis]